LQITQAPRGIFPAFLGATALLALFFPSPSGPTPTLAAGPCTTTAASSPLDSEEQGMLVLINTYRASNGADPLVIQQGLERSALWKSADMAQNHYLEHDDLNRGWQQRFADCGYSHSFDGENIADEFATAQQTFVQWRESPPHNQNMLDADFHAIGIGRAEASDGTWYWATDFGGSTDPNSTSPGGPSGPTSPGSGFAPVLVPPLVAPATLPSTVAVGATELTNTPGNCLNVHATPSLSSTATACLADGTPVLIVGGPVTADGHIWWSAAGLGWVAGDLLRPTS